MVAAIIVAAGKGTRMKDLLRKQYLSLAGLPILTRTLLVFEDCALINQIVLVIPPDNMDFCKNNIISPANITKKILLVSGGERRQDSVYNGLKKVDPSCALVVIHDGVRPFVQNDQLIACISGARKFGACLLGVPAYDTLKQTDASSRIIQTLPRDNVWLAQTPQAFRYDLIKKAHEKARSEGYTGTDDASLVERLGVAVTIIEGSRSNLKITSRADLKIARGLLDCSLSD
ncbi:MAG: 2-C-methyl-D-erythritol 4-phosphate cytidylyltransferase [Deltaproteobacteria bacterium]|nr:2-C-methyl-D-erythritol 4-phosphate cytidylyltransferase [Deltaproteobacteria bacterium]